MRELLRRVTIGSVFMLFAMSPGLTDPVAAVQVGASGTGNSYTYEMRTKINEPGNFVYGDLARTYWPGVTVPDGTFFQAGVVDSSNDWGSDKCSTGFATFVTALYGTTSLFSDLYNIQNCNYTGDHFFRLTRDFSSTQTLWQWSLDGTKDLGPVLKFDNFGNQTFQRKYAGLVSEIVYSGNIPSGKPFPTVHYPTALQFRDSNGNWASATHGVAIISSDRHGLCEYAIKSPSDNYVVTGREAYINPPQCYANGDDLWN